MPYGFFDVWTVSIPHRKFKNPDIIDFVKAKIEFPSLIGSSKTISLTHFA